MSDINIAELLRTGNIVRNRPAVSFSEWIIRSVNAAQENDIGYPETYWLELEAIRPDICERLSGTHFDPFCEIPDQFSLVEMTREIYKRW
jgi:hypothetical protein